MPIGRLRYADSGTASDAGRSSLLSLGRVNLKFLDVDAGVTKMRRHAAEIERRADEEFAEVWPVFRDLAVGTAE